ncbi:class A beta-lactamase [Luteimonas sp. A478]
MDRRAFLALAAAAGAPLALPIPAFALSPPPAPSPLDLGPLEARHGGRLGVCAMGPGRVGWRMDERFAYASTFKLFLAACVLDRVQQGAERLDRAISIRERDMVPHAPVTGPAVGSSLTIEALCKAAVEISDNPAANILLRELGGLETFQAWYHGIGDEVTRVDRYETQLNSALPGDPRDTTTPAQAVANLDRVLLRGLLAPELLAKLQTWLVETTTGPGRIKAGVPNGWRVAHKTGTGARNSCNNIGVAFPPTGAPVVIAVYYTGAEASPEALDAVIAEATRAAFVALRRV